jgi:Arc/MetJ-type ribon-helix-helix transcriptional regulator
MGQTKYRAQILLEPEQHAALVEAAEREKRSISEIVRMAVSQWLDERRADENLRRRLQALDQIDQHREAILTRRNGDPLELDLAETIKQVREERDDELLDSFGHRS